jgi:hypothetical protein
LTLLLCNPPQATMRWRRASQCPAGYTVRTMTGGLRGPRLGFELEG